MLGLQPLDLHLLLDLITRIVELIQPTSYTAKEAPDLLFSVILLNRTLAYYRWFSDFAAGMREQLFGQLFQPIKYLIFYLVKRKVRKDLWNHGIGRHKEQELYGIAERDLLAMSELLGHKNFLFGDKPCLADVGLFAFVASSVWDCPKSPFAELTKSKAKNLEHHAQRMKLLYYPDWDEIIAKKHKSE